MRPFKATATLLALALAAVTAPLQADPPDEVDVPEFFIFPDFENELLVFWNIAALDFCDWADSGYDGPPPVADDVSVRIVPTGKGASTATYHTTGPLELWPLGATCDEPGDGPWAVGDAMVSASDNDLTLQGPRTNTWGDRAQGTVVDVEGRDWHYSWAYTAHCIVDCDEGYSTKVEDYNLRRKGW